jgi:hypothetical protein
MVTDDDQPVQPVQPAVRISPSISSFLGGRFPDEKQLLDYISTPPLPYRTAYKTVLTVTTLRKVMDSLSMSHKPRIDGKVHPSGEIITIEHLSTWAGLDVGTYRNMRTKAKKMWTALHVLRAGVPEITQDEHGLLYSLEALLGSTRLAPLQDRIGDEGHGDEEIGTITNSVVKYLDGRNIRAQETERI